MSDRTRAPGPVVYREPGRSYLSALVLLLLLAAGFAGDLALGGGLVHVVGWIVAAVLVVGVDALATHAARVNRSLTITADELRLGDAVIARGKIVAVEPGVSAELPVLGRTFAEGLPRGASGVIVRLADDDLVVVPTRRPERVAEALDVALDAPEVRPAEPADLPLLAEIDARADSLFRVAGLDLPAIPFPSDELPGALAIFVAGRPPVGFVRVDEVDGLAHVEALAVIPGRMRQGLGTALLDAACRWARGRGYPAITLITYADVPWNAPYYAARGFSESSALTPELAELRAWEQAVGLDAAGRRMVMRREL